MIASKDKSRDAALLVHATRQGPAQEHASSTRDVGRDTSDECGLRHRAVDVIVGTAGTSQSETTRPKLPRMASTAIHAGRRVAAGHRCAFLPEKIRKLAAASTQTAMLL